MIEEHIHRMEDLLRKNQAFAVATVVWREVPSSGKSGDKAIITRFGELTGWVGGGCVRGIILKEADDAIRTGRARLVRVGQSPGSQKKEGIVEYKMTCHSDGSVDIFIEPVLPALHLVIVGKSAIARSLAGFGKLMGWRVSAVAPDAKPDTFGKVDELITQLNLKQVKTGPGSYIVVCTQGEQDELALQQALDARSDYIGFVASRKKNQAVFAYLESAGVDREKIQSIRSPAGIDIRAKKPEEVAVSILAEIIQVQHSLPVAGQQPGKEIEERIPETSYYINPVCGVPVDKHNPKHVVMYKGEQVYFCCDGCKVKFEAEPDRYMQKMA